MDDLEALFDSVDGLKTDLIDFGIAGGAAVLANVAYGFVESKVLKVSFLASLDAPGADGKPSMVGGLVRGAAALTVGVIGGSQLTRFNRNVATGVAVGLALRGVLKILRTLLPADTQTSIGLNTAFSGLSDGEYRLLGPGISGAPVMVEEVHGLHGATTTVEEVSGLSGATTTIERLNGLAATLQ